MSPASAVILLGIVSAAGLESAASPKHTSASPLRSGALLRGLALTASLLLLASCVVAVGTAENLARAGAGAGLLVFGGWVRAAAMRNLGCHFRTEAGAAALVTQGVHAHVRHPSELGVLAWVAGLLVAAPTTGALALGVVQLPLLLARVRIEDGELAARFGAQWERYAQNTPAFFPRFR
jgi:protein-S-isoprenylcysteine O-methyltransferase Ste14